MAKRAKKQTEGAWLILNDYRTGKKHTCSFEDFQADPNHGREHHVFNIVSKHESEEEANEALAEL